MVEERYGSRGICSPTLHKRYSTEVWCSTETDLKMENHMNTPIGIPKYPNPCTAHVVLQRNMPKKFQEGK
jgi:hypothetical protein